MIVDTARAGLVVLSALVFCACGDSSNAEGAGGEDSGRQRNERDAGDVDGGGRSPGVAVPTSTVTFISTDLDMPNPERGFFSFSGELSTASASTFASLHASGQRIAYASANLAAFRTSAISGAYLDNLSNGFARARNAGMKLVLRFLYDDTSAGQDASLTTVQQHLAQLKPILAANADVIAVIQAGFIGAWGEWHTSSSNLTTESNRLGVRDALLGALPSGVFLDFRNPSHVIGWFPTVLGEGGAFQNTSQASIGIHNDCFMASATDQGTYSSNGEVQATQRAYVKALSAFTPFGGETCVGNAPRRTCNDILAEGRDYHLAYLNRTYETSFHNAWISDGCFEEVSRSLGYRLRLEGLTSPVSASRKGESTFEVKLRNVGWARIFSPRKLTVVLRHGVSGDLLVGASTNDVRASLVPAATESVTIPVPVTIPAEASPGEYDVYLALPDASPSLADDPRYAVRFANADDEPKNQAWDSENARFRTGATVTIE